MWALALVVLLGTACSLPTGTGAVSVASPLEREAADHLLWATRGKDFGLLARTYCVAGSPSERTWMRDAFNATASPAKVTIICPKWSED
jgi:hypothetical protein